MTDDAKSITFRKISIDEKIARIRSRIRLAYALLKPCRVCPRQCGVNRFQNELGYCGVGFSPVLSSDNLHHGEEPPISGIRGSGTIFFTGCNLGCVFCQNYPISQLRHGNRISIVRLSERILRLQDAGAHNINFVTPTHFAPQAMGALLIAYQRGLRIPIVYNCGGYESIDMIQLWDGIVDIYMPDMKYSDPAMADTYSHAANYPVFNRMALKEMHRQVGNLVLDETGIAIRGLIVRHLVMPDNIAGTDRIFRFIAEELSPQTAISLMSQYFPAHRAPGMDSIHRRIHASEYASAKKLLKKYGLTHGWVQDQSPLT